MLKIIREINSHIVFDKTQTEILNYTNINQKNNNI